MKRGTKDGEPIYRARCSPCHHKTYDISRSVPPKYRRHKEGACARCGFEPEHSCQLDVDHVDGDHKNDDPANLQTLCANCHRLKTHQGHSPLWCETIDQWPINPRKRA